jgi:glycosyltransferase involved in cell wall biosynthesis
VTAVIELLGPATGGIRTHVGELADRLRQRQLGVVVAGPASQGSFVDVVVEVPERPDPIALWRARRTMRSVPGDLIHAHGLKAAWTAIGTGRPVVLTAHNIVLGDGLGAHLNRWLERSVVRRVDHLISPSRAIDVRFAALVPPDRRSVILPVSPPARPQRDRAEVRADLGVSEDATLVVAAARLHPQKDLGVLLRAFAQTRQAHPDAELRIVGSGPLEDELATLVRSLGLPAEVLAGPSPAAVEELAAADVVALSSVWEAVPLVVLEAMQLGRCIVTTRVGMVEELVADGAGAIVEVGDVDGFAAALGERLADPQLRQREGTQAAARVDLIADPDQLVDAVCAVYRRVCLP